MYVTLTAHNNLIKVNSSTHQLKGSRESTASKHLFQNGATTAVIHMTIQTRMLVGAS